jgi:hypothetical protein
MTSSETLYINKKGECIMAQSSFERWSAEIKVEKISSSILDQELDLYFISGVMNENQRDTVKERLPILSEFKLDADKVVICSLVTYKRLQKAYEEFSHYSKIYRGQYYVVANKIVDACRPVISH